MIFHEGRNEVIPVVVAFLKAQRHGISNPAAGRLKELRMQLLLEELIGGTLVDQDRRAACSIFDLRDQLRRIISAPLAVIRAEITTERLLPPRTALRRRNRREC